MQITESSSGSWTVLTLSGKIDNAGSEELKAKLLPLMTGGGVALDFTGVEYITSSGFRVLMMALKQQSAAKGRLVLGNMSEALRGFFEMAGLGTLFKITANIRDVISQAP